MGVVSLFGLNVSISPLLRAGFRIRISLQTPKVDPASRPGGALPPDNCGSRSAYCSWKSFQYSPRWASSSMSIRTRICLGTKLPRIGAIATVPRATRFIACSTGPIG